MPLKIEDIDPIKPDLHSRSRDVRRYIAREGCCPADKGVSPDPDVFMDGNDATDDGVISYLDMPPQHRIAGHDDAISEATIMRDMGIGHNKVIIAEHGLSIAEGGTTVYGHILPDDIVVPDND